MTTIHSRIINVAQIAQRSARSSDEQAAAAALLDELKHVEVVVQAEKGVGSAVPAGPTNVPAAVSLAAMAAAQDTFNRGAIEAERPPVLSGVFPPEAAGGLPVEEKPAPRADAKPKGEKKAK